MLFLVSLDLKSQKDTLSYAEQLAALEAEMDFLSIFSLIESVLATEAAPGSELLLHLGFTSSVTSAGRDYDLDQRGIAPGVAFYHKSGLFSDITGYWNSDIEPNYNPTVWSSGYLGDLGPRWSYSFDYERWFFNPKDSAANPLKNSFGASINYDLKIVNLGIDYSFLFGDESAHRILGSLGKTVDLGKWWIFDRISLYPSAIILFGNNNITQLRITQAQLTDRQRTQTERLITLNNLSPNQRNSLIASIQSAFENGRITRERRNEFLQLLATAQSLTEGDVQDLQTLLEQGFEETFFEEGNAFGLMNYSFSLPLTASINHFSIILNYSYSIPVSLPGEFFEVDPIGYFGASLSYRIPFK